MATTAKAATAIAFWNRFRTQLEAAQAFFAAESAAVSITTEDWGTIHRDDVAPRLVLVRGKLRTLAGEG